MPATGLKVDGVKPRGRPRQIDRERIVEAALDVGLESLTMRAVAERLGVHPSALNYHVSGRGELRRAVASSVFRLALPGPSSPSPGATSPEGVRADAPRLARHLLAPGPPALYFPLLPLHA